MADPTDAEQPERDPRRVAEPRANGKAPESPRRWAVRLLAVGVPVLIVAALLSVKLRSILPAAFAGVFLWVAAGTSPGRRQVELRGSWSNLTATARGISLIAVLYVAVMAVIVDLIAP